MDNAADESWELLLSLLPAGWEQKAVLCGAVERMRGFASVGELLRVLLLHVGKGYSLRETAVRARRAGLAAVSDVALLLRLRKVQPWWRQLCWGLLQESGWSLGADPRQWNVRAVDGTLVREPGRTGAQWRIHYSLRLPSLECDGFEITAARGAGTGEKLERLAVVPGDLILADRGFCRPGGGCGGPPGRRADRTPAQFQPAAGARRWAALCGFGTDPSTYASGPDRGVEG